MRLWFVLAFAWDKQEDRRKTVRSNEAETMLVGEWQLQWTLIVSLSESRSLFSSHTSPRRRLAWLHTFYRGCLVIRGRPSFLLNIVFMYLCRSYRINLMYICWDYPERKRNEPNISKQEKSSVSEPSGEMNWDILQAFNGWLCLGFFGGRWDKGGRHLHPPLLCQQTGINDMIFDSDSHPLMHQNARFSQTKVNSTKQVSTNGCLKVLILALTVCVREIAAFPLVAFGLAAFPPHVEMPQPRASRSLVLKCFHVAAYRSGRVFPSHFLPLNPLPASTPV